MTKYSRKEIMSLSNSAIDAKVKIQGTKFDRKRKLSDSTIETMNNMVNRGKKVSEIAEKYNIDTRTVKYWTDPEYRAYKLATASGKHTGKTNITPSMRADYKRALVKVGANVIINE